MKPQYKVYREASIFYLNTPFFDAPSFWKNLNPQVRTKKLVNFCLLLFSLKISLRDTSFQISLIFLGFYLSPECLLNFLWLFSIYGVYIPRKFINLCIFTHTPVPHSKLQVEFFENLFPPRRKGWRKLWFTLWKFNHKIWRWLGTSLFIFCIICNFSKCDGFTVFWIISIKQCGIKFDL